MSQLLVDYVLDERSEVLLEGGDEDGNIEGGILLGAQGEIVGLR